MVKESVLKFDGAPLLPERIAYDLPYKLSDAEAYRYPIVTDYVRAECKREKALENGRRAGARRRPAWRACADATTGALLSAVTRSRTTS
jgi:hypothetical protein